MPSVSDRVLLLVGEHCDLEERLAVVPPSAHARGVYLRNVLRVMEEHGKLAEFQDIFGPDRLSPLRYYPVSDYMMRLAAGGALLKGPEHVHLGMHEICRLNALAVSQSLLGRTLLRLLSPDPNRLLQQALSGRRQTNDYGRWELSFPAPRQARMHLVQEYVWIETALVGAAVGTFEMIGMDVEVQCEMASRFEGVHLISW